MGGDRDKLPTGFQVDKDKVARHRISFTRVGSLFFLHLQLRHSFCCFFFPPSEWSRFEKVGGPYLKVKGGDGLEGPSVKILRILRESFCSGSPSRDWNIWATCQEVRHRVLLESSLLRSDRTEDPREEDATGV